MMVLLTVYAILAALNAAFAFDCAAYRGLYWTGRKWEKTSPSERRRDRWAGFGWTLLAVVLIAAALTT